MIVTANGSVLQSIFKAYHQRQAILLPPSLEELIAVNHPIRIVDDILSEKNCNPWDVSIKLVAAVTTQVY